MIKLVSDEPEILLQHLIITRQCDGGREGEMINCVTSDLEIEDNDFGENKLEICRQSVAHTSSATDQHHTYA